MTLRHIVSCPADLAEVFRERAKVCRKAADSVRAKHERDLWEVQAKAWSAAASIAAATTFQPEVK